MTGGVIFLWPLSASNIPGPPSFGLILFILNLRIMEKATRKKKLGGFPAVGVVISVTIALVVIGLFSLIIIYSNQLEKQVRRNINMQVYLRSNLTTNQRLQIENKLLTLPYITQEPGEKIRFVSREEAAKNFIAETGEDFTKFLGENPLRDAYLITIDPAYHTEEKMTVIKNEIQKMNGVFQVFYVSDLIEDVNANVTQIGVFLGVLILALLIAVALLINNTLRIALFSQRFLIRSMQLVGATNWFIQRPFLVRSVGYGFLGALLASLLLGFGTQYLQEWIPDLRLVHNNDDFLMLVAILFLVGITFTTLSTLFSIRKYLKMSLDELY
jgi:cell division transport system permease protein